jgi:hypothetical protein
VKVLAAVSPSVPVQSNSSLGATRGAAGAAAVSGLGYGGCALPEQCSEAPELRNYATTTRVAISATMPPFLPVQILERDQSMKETMVDGPPATLCRDEAPDRCALLLAGSA